MPKNSINYPSASPKKTVLYNNRAAISNSAYHDVAANYLDSGFVRRCITHPTRPNLVYNTEISPTRSIFIRLHQPIGNIQHRSCNVWKCVGKTYRWHRIPTRYFGQAKATIKCKYNPM